MNKPISMRFTFSAPRWAGLGRAIRDTLFLLGLDCRIQVEKSWFRENLQIEVTGPREQIDAFIAWAVAARKAYNHE